MTTARPQPSSHARRLLWPFVGMLLLSVTLQGASLVAMVAIETTLDLSRQQVSLAAGQRALVEQFENATYLAMVGLATSDWEMLLRQRSAAKELAERFEAGNKAMLEGGSARIGDLEVTLPRIEEPEAREALTALPELWKATHAAHLRVLRSEHHSLKQNPALEEFRASARQLEETLGTVSGLIQRRAREETLQLSRIQRLVPVGAFLLTLGLFAYVLVRILLPFAAATEELTRSEGELRRARDELEQRVSERTQELAQANEALRQAQGGLEARVRERTQELKETQRRAVELARQAGMAELATNVLHNVGNVLNSINTSSQILGERLRELRVEPLLKVSTLLGEQRASLAAFFSEDGRGRRLPQYLDKLGQHLASDRAEMLEMTGEMQRHVEHIRAIVQLQQTYAMSSNIVEVTSLEELVEDALRMSEAALGRHGITVERQFVPLPRMMLDKHKMLQIILNLVSNAKYALSIRPPGQRRLTLKVDHPTQERIRMQVSDNGIGIPRELLTKIFQHGFTTRHDGHGFGLHSCAIAARALGGSLEAHSEGPGMGATFTLELPFQPGAPN
jgi:two-component system NtrC family sensor kinase